MNKTLLEFVEFVQKNNGIGDKAKLVSLAKDNFRFFVDGKVMYTDSFAVRFSYSKSEAFSNTILSLSKLQKYDHIPFLVILVKGKENKIFLANSTFINKISHSSQALTIRNIKGSFNGSNIIKVFEEIENNEQNIDRLFAIHSAIGFYENLQRIVDATQGIVPTGRVYELGEKEKEKIINSVQRAITFCTSDDFLTLKETLDQKVKRYEKEILIASHIENTNIRGRIIEYIIAGDDDSLKVKLIKELEQEYEKIPSVRTENALGDYTHDFSQYHTETDIKTKIVYLNSNPKGYNIDKFLKYHQLDNSVFMLYIVGIDKLNIFNKTLVSVFQEDIVEATLMIKHWAGRNSRGVTQFEGNKLQNLLKTPGSVINQETAKKMLIKMFSL